MLASLENINFFYNSNLLLKDINLSIFPSTLICIVGASGVGKSTLLYILAGLLKPNTGSYYFEGINCYEQNILSLAKFRSNNIGILFQDFRLLPFLSVEQNIKFPMYFSGVSYKKNIVLDLIHQFNLIHCSKLYPHQISGGEAQRVALARAMILSPKLLLLDEFTANLDSETEKNIMNVILSLKKYNLTILCITHSKYVMSQADTIWRLENKTLKN